MVRIGEPLRVVSRKRRWPSPTTIRLIGRPDEMPRTIGVLPHMPMSRLLPTIASTIGSAVGYSRQSTVRS